RLLINDKNPKDRHPDFVTLGGVRVEGHAVAPTKLRCEARRDGGTVVFKGRLGAGAPGELPTKAPARCLVEGTANGKFRTQQSALANVAADGTFTATIRRAEFTEGICMFAGTSTLASATSGFIPVQ